MDKVKEKKQQETRPDPLANINRKLDKLINCCRIYSVKKINVYSFLQDCHFVSPLIECLYYLTPNA